MTLTDSLGRVTMKRIRGEYDIRYLYSQRYKHQLLAEYAGGTSKTYTYDRFDRVATMKETAPDGKWLKKTFTYSDGGLILSIDYESQSGEIAHENYRYTNGHNSSIHLDGVPVIRTNTVNEFLQPTSVTTGDMTRTYTYSQYGLPVRRTMGNLMDVSYQFDPARGNLMSRTDNIHDITETFSYDTMNRLTGTGDRAITYSPDGNITSIEDVGNLSYADENHPYRVTQLDLTGNAVPAAPQSITYTCYQRPAQVTESGRSATFTYDADGRRVKMYLSDGADPVLSRYYLGDRYEIDVTPEGNTERLYIGGDAYNAPVVYVKDGDSEWTMYNIGRDYLGNITHIATADGTPVAEYSYDPWGRLRNPETHEVFAPGEEPELFLGRGYTGHEHLTDFGLINMNARLYDPVIGRFLSPDPYVQHPESTQGFNRYTYCLNNPLVYSDESGKYFVIDAFFAGLFSGGGWKEAIKRAGNDLKIFAGLFVTDPNKTFFGRVWEFFSRGIWQPIQTFGGIVTAYTYNLFGINDGIESINYLYGATVIQTREASWGAVTQGNYIIGDHDIAASPDNYLFQHEYGHYIQSQKFGWYYYGKFGIPSLISASNDKDHNMNPVEQDANIRALMYFNRHIPNYSDWQFKHNPIKNYNATESFHNQTNQSALNSGILHLNWFEPFGPFIISATANSIINNKKY